MSGIRPALRGSINTPPLKSPEIRHLHMDSEARKHHQTFTLPDGRLLGFAEYGVPTGRPLLYFHGYPASRLEAGPVDDIAKRQGLRVLALDRPGFGLSSPQPRRRIVDWPADVRAFADGMNLSRFAVMGLSGGGPYALACAEALPREMLTGVGLFASAPPWAAGRHRMSIYRRVMSWMSNYWPSALRITLNMCVGALNWITSTNWATSKMDAWLIKKSGEREKSGEDAKPARPVVERREDLLRLLYKEPFAQGADAAVQEARLLSADDWGFRFEDVDYETVRIWHGSKDGNAPIEMMRWLAEKLPHCELEEFKADTHYTMFQHLESALAELVPEKSS